MTTIKTRVLNVRVVGFSAPERQMLNSIFLLSVAPARQIGYRLWNSDSGTAPDMYLLDGDSESAVASWQAAFSNTSDRTLVVGSKNTDLGCASAARPLGLKVVGAMDRLAIALANVTRETIVHEVSQPRAGASLPGASLPGAAARVADTCPTTHPRQNASLPRAGASMPAPTPATLSASMNAPLPNISAAANTLSAGSHAMTANSATATTHAGSMPSGMTASAPAATVLPHVTLQPNVVPALDKTHAEKPAPIAAIVPMSGVTPLSPSALSAAVAPSPQRVNLRVVPNPSPLAASLPAAAAMTAAAPAPAVAVAVAPIAPIAPVAPVAPVAVTAPVAPAVAPAPVAPATPAHVARQEEPQFRVLAVDDSPLMRTFLQNKLQPYGIVPDFAASGEEALFKISKQHFDLIFLDVMLPGMDGYDVCKMIKKNKDNSLMKVVMLTSKDKTFDKIRGTMAGCDGYLTKPVDEMKLRGIIERHTPTRR